MRAKILGLIALISILTCLPLNTAQAAWTHERDGILLGFNLGGGTAAVDFTGQDDRESSLGGSFRLGYAFTPQFAAGIEGTFWTKEVIDDVTWTFNVTTAALTYYPGAAGFYVRGGIGAGSMELEIDQGGGVTNKFSDDGFGFLLGAGYEWRLTRKFALGPAVDYSYARVNELDISLNYVNFTLGANWYF
jgi:outer membrane autotransporter protein